MHVIINKYIIKCPHSCSSLPVIMPSQIGPLLTNRIDRDFVVSLGERPKEITWPAVTLDPRPPRTTNCPGGTLNRVPHQRRYLGLIDIRALHVFITQNPRSAIS